MASSRLLGLGCAAAVLAGGAGPASAVAATPDPGPVLTRLDGPAVDLRALAASRDATVLVFFGTACPCVKRYQARVEALPGQYPLDRVQVLLVSSNADDDEASLRRAVEERGLRLPLLVDWSGALARQLGVRTTPSVVVLDRTSAVRFRGWVDNERLPGEAGREPWLERALDGVLAGTGGFATASPMYGCAITRSLGAERTPAPRGGEAAPACHVP
jgi:peroxiredoxin